MGKNGIKPAEEKQKKMKMKYGNLNMDKHAWYQTKTSRRSVAEFKDLTISTDGIYTFKNYDGKSYPRVTESQILYEFFEAKTNSENPNKLKKSLMKIKDEMRLAPSDDITMIRAMG